MDVTVVGGGSFVAAGHVFRDQPTLGTLDDGDTGLENVLAALGQGVDKLSERASTRTVSPRAPSSAASRQQTPASPRLSMTLQKMSHSMRLG